jgi:transposase
LGDLLPADHAVRFVAEYVDGLDLRALGIKAQAAVEGAPAYNPRALLAAWLYAFMTQERTTRRVERSCRENIPMMWLTGLQHPDHVTLWRFYNANRPVIRQLLKQTVKLAMEAGLVDFVLQAVDGSKVAISSGDELCDRAGLEKLLAQLETEIAKLERAQQGPGEGTPAVRQTGRALSGKQARRVRLAHALDVQQQRMAEASPKVRRRAAKRAAKRRDAASAVAQGAAAEAMPTPVEPTAASQPEPVQAAEVPPAAEAQAAPLAGPQVSTTDPEARPLRGRHGFCVGYNSQVVVDSKAQIVVAADVVDSGNDLNQLAAMLAEAEAMTGRPAQAAVADTGYASITDIAAAQATGTAVYVPDQREQRKDGPAHNRYHKAHFCYDAASDSYVCPLGQRLAYSHQTRINGQEGWAYRGKNCQGCAAQESGACTTAKQRTVTRFGNEEALAAHAAKMQTEGAQEIVRKRKAIVEPVFGLLREQLGLLRFLVRGLEKVKAEWRLLCVGHNLRKLWKLWWQPKVQQVAAAN